MALCIVDYIVRPANENEIYFLVYLNYIPFFNFDLEEKLGI